MRKLPIFALATLALAATHLAGAGIVSLDEAPVIRDVQSPFPATELFPVNPGINSERGFAVAVEGKWLALGAPREDFVEPGETSKKDAAGAVYLFHWSETTWDQKAKLVTLSPRTNAQFGFALAMRDGLLAVAAPGEGAVYVFGLRGDAEDEEGHWVREQKLRSVHPGTFGRSLALGGGLLAVGDFGAHGVPDGVVYLYGYRASSGTWSSAGSARPRIPQKGERFGAAVAWADEALVVGAPGYDIGTGPPADDAGAVYVFQQEGARWKETAKLLPPVRPPRAGQQFGSAVATDGAGIFVGAPTADLAGTNSGALYWFVQEARNWRRRTLPAIEGVGPRDQLGASLASSEDLLVVGAHASPPGSGTGKIHVLLRATGLWTEKPLIPRNAELRDLAGFAVAVAGERVVMAGVLGDQGDGAAGAAWSFECSASPASCSEKAEAVARDPDTGFPFGASVALTGQLLAVGALPRDDDSAGVVYVYRPAGRGWRQEARLLSRYLGDGFGTSVAVEDSPLAEGTLLAVGAPRARSSPVSGSPGEFPDGSVDLFVRHGSSWVFETTLAPSASSGLASETSVDFGTSVAVADGVVAVGAPGSDKVYVFQKGEESWNYQVLTAPAEGFGAAVALRGEVLAIGAPEAGGGMGAAYVSVRHDKRWSDPQPILSRTTVEEVDALHLGAAVSVGDGLLAVGAPGFHDGDGTVFVLEGAGTSWRMTSQLSALAPRRFGSSVALRGDLLAVGAPGQGDTDPGSDDLDRAAVFERQNGVWTVIADLDALQPPHGDKFGAAVALSDGFLVVTSPDLPRGDRVTVFTLPGPELAPQ